MKRLITITMTVGLLFLGNAFAESDETKVDKRQGNQKSRIKSAVESGELTKKEARNLKKGQQRINKAERRANKDGVVTKREQKRLNKMQNKQSRKIKRKSNNKRSRN